MPLPAKRRSPLPFLFFLSFAAVFLYSFHYRSSIPIDTSLANLISNSIPSANFSLTIKLLAYDRAASINRCLRSLASADYSSDRVDLHILLDHFPNPTNPNSSHDAILIDRRLNSSREILQLVDGFDWAHGRKIVHYRSSNAGLQAQWIEAWWPASDDEFAFIVEDDLELSPLYYRFLKALVTRYYYDKENYSPYIYGASLQRPRFVAGKHGNKLQVDGETQLFLYQMVGTWGQLLFPRPWKEFRFWYDAHKAKGIKPVLQGMVTTGWYKKMGDRIWTPWFIKFIHSRGYFNIYTNFLHERSLSTSHRDAGVNYGKSAGPDSYLLNKGSLDINHFDVRPLRNLKWYDFCFREVLPGRLVRNLDELRTVLNSFKKSKPVLLISLYRTLPTIALNLLCHFEKLNVQNYIFIGGSTEFLHDLARRGHPAVDATHLMSTIRHDYSLHSKSSKQVITEIVAKAIILKKLLEFGYSTWLVDGNMIPSGDFLFEPPNPSYNLMAAADIELMFLSSSTTTLGLWSDNLVARITADANSLESSNSLSTDHNFVWFATKALQDNNVKVWSFDESMIVKLAAESAVDKSLFTGTKLVFWSPVMTGSVERALSSVDMWLLDEDSSCAAVVCHK